MNTYHLFAKLSKEEQVAFFTMNTTEYYEFVNKMPSFEQIQKKLDTNEKLSEEDWDYILMRLFFIFLHALKEQDRMDIATKIAYLFAKVNMKIAKKDGPLYNECYKITELISSFQKEKEINQDLLEGIQAVLHSLEEQELIDLLKQNQEANIFRENQRAYVDAYDNTTMGEISPNEKLYIHALNRAYQEEKKYLKKIS